ncbi:MAG: serine/threonine protein kinase [Deltaproteobacteria bacterium]|nr:serine/threonine protein kinase [Deltaproteobacteria bacterium]
MKKLFSSFRYERIKPLGKGGMGEVYLARFYPYPGVSKQVVVKNILSDHANDALWQDAFLKEARVMSGLSHSNIVQLLDFGKKSEGFFLVMEYVEGGTVLDLLKASTQVPEAMALYIALEVLKALAFLHQRKIFHFDLSPSNILISKSGEVKLTDFGIAQPLNSVARAGRMPGKPGYMSPEQKEGKPCGPASDLYGFGIVLCEMLTGQRNADAVTFLKYPYLQMVLEPRLEKRGSLERIEKRISEVLIQTWGYVSQRDFKQFVQGYEPWQPPITKLITDAELLNAPRVSTRLLKLFVSVALGIPGWRHCLSSLRGMSRGHSPITFNAISSIYFSMGLHSSVAWAMASIFCFLCLQSSVPTCSKGYVSLSAKPWAYVYVNSYCLGMTPVIQKALPVGEHKIVLKNPVFSKNISLQVNIRTDESTVHRVSF